MDLQAVMTLKTKIEGAEQRLLALRENARAITVKLDGLPRNKNVTSRVEKFATEIVDAENELATLMIELVETTETLTRLIQQRVEGKAAIVLIRRYAMCETFKEIAANLHYTSANVYYLHRQGVRSFYVKIR